MNASISLYNTLSRSVETFEPINADRVTMYVCGPTVYSYAHIGNARSAVAFDVLFRVLRHQFGEQNVIYARNFTDVDDKIIAAAQERNEQISEITNRYTNIYLEDMGHLNVLRPNIEPRATQHIDDMIELISSLIDGGFAYENEGHVLFNTPTFTEYGSLSRRNLDDIIAGARIEVAPYKKDATDFVLWKPSSQEEPGWDSPWGYGRPGWHIECSAMIAKTLGTNIDIHGGGHDLTFPHHENELAQSRCGLNTKTPVRYWLHNGFVNIEEEKMSKSLGNVVLVHNLLKETKGEVIRLALINAHYRSPLNWGENRLKEAKSILDSWYRVIAAHKNAKPTKVNENVAAALNDDLNTPLAISHIHQLVNKINQNESDSLIGELLASGQLLGLLEQDPTAWFQGEGEEDNNKIEALIKERLTARSNKDFARADAIRDELDAMNIAIEDSSSGTTWRKK